MKKNLGSIEKENKIMSEARANLAIAWTIYEKMTHDKKAKASRVKLPDKFKPTPEEKTLLNSFICNAHVQQIFRITLDRAISKLPNLDKCEFQAHIAKNSLRCKLTDQATKLNSYKEKFQLVELCLDGDLGSIMFFLETATNSTQNNQQSPNLIALGERGKKIVDREKRYQEELGTLTLAFN